MKDRRALLSSASAIVVFFGLFLFAQHARAAVSVCQCSCVDNESVVTQYASAPTGGRACTDMCNERFSGQSSTLRNAYPTTVNLPSGETSQCACEYPSQTSSEVYRKKTPGQTSCTADCSAACGGSANLNPDQNQTQNTRQVECVTSADCAVGSFASLNPTCEILPAYGANAAQFPNGIPTCIPHVTKKEADNECAKHGGIANGGVCDFVQSGDNPAAYFISRPYIQSNGAYAYANFTATQVQGGPSSLWGQLDAWVIPTNATIGACHLFGLEQDIDFSSIQFSTSTATALNQLIHGQQVNLGDGGSKRYVCVKRRQDQCGYVTPVNVPIGTSAPTKKSLYSCMSTSLITPSTYCITQGTGVTGATVQAADLCTTPNTRCCAKNACVTDGDCGAFKMCDKQSGKCIPNPVCDTEDITRRCRQPAEAEKADPSICSPEYVITDMHTRCPIRGQACCIAPDSTALSSCAIDLRQKPEMFSWSSDPTNAWKNYLCIPTATVDPGEWVPMPDGSKKLLDPRSGGHCVTNDVPKSGVPGSTASRCGQGAVCCDRSVGGSALATQLNGRKQRGESCGMGPTLDNYSCQQALDNGGADGVISDLRATELGFSNALDYLSALAASGYCRVTPVSSGGAQSILQNKECVNNTICCHEQLQKCDPEPCLNALDSCDPKFHVCVPKAAANIALPGQSCVTLAENNGALPADTSRIVDQSGAPASAFSCQSVTANTPGIDTSCIPNGAGCGNVNAQADANGATILCCAPGIGGSPGTTAGITAAPASADQTAGRTLFRLPACITSGVNCTLDDIIFTGASFANFLLAISGSVFLAIFVYAGFKYLTAGTGDGAKKGKQMIIQSSIGIILILGAYVFVNFIQSTLISRTSGNNQTPTCGYTEDTKNMSCQILVASPDDANAIAAESAAKHCVSGRCPGPKNYLCCP